tara:strand:+ start:186 stop:512 length:327 start_codon:yes stop_codon:yes gene_type:complete
MSNNNSATTAAAGGRGGRRGTRGTRSDVGRGEQNTVGDGEQGGQLFTSQQSTALVAFYILQTERVSNGSMLNSALIYFLFHFLILPQINHLFIFEFIYFPLRYIISIL